MNFAFAFSVLYLMLTVNYVKGFPILNFLQYENVISFGRNFGQFCENLKIFVKSIFNWPRTHMITYIFLPCLPSSFVDL